MRFTVAVLAGTAGNLTGSMIAYGLGLLAPRDHLTRIEQPIAAAGVVGRLPAGF